MRAGADPTDALRRGAERIRDLPSPFPGVPRPAVDSAFDWLFFVVGGVAAVWFSWVLLRESFAFGWWQILFVAVFWVLIAYLLLPRLHRILTRIYVPDYFIGRARTSDGLLGDPVNLALLGSEPQVHAAMELAGWTRADDLSLTTGLRIVRSTLTRSSYLQAPVSPLLLFGRKQDFAYQQEVDGSPGKRHHVRFWRCPDGWLLPGGHRADWMAAGTYDRSVGLSLFTLQVTHKIDPDTDVERDHIVRTVSRAQSAVKVHVIRDFSTGYHSRNGGGDSIETDGDLPVIDLRAIPTRDEPVAPTDSRDRRPAPIVVGAALLVVRAVVGVWFGVSVLLGWEAVVSTEDQLEGVDTTTVLAVVGALAGLLAAFDVVIALFVFFGHNWARVLALVLSTVSVAFQVIAVETGDAQADLLTNLPGIGLDVLLLLALSSERALVYARRPHKAPKRISGRPGDAAVV